MVFILFFNMILNYNFNFDLKWNVNERFQFLKIGVVFMKMDLGGLQVLVIGEKCLLCVKDIYLVNVGIIIIQVIYD